MKRFWTQVTVTGDGTEGHGIALDGRPLRTPAKRPVVLPGRRLAEAVAAEWAGVEGEIRPHAMPATRAANTALDRVAPDRAVVAGMLAGYGETDLLCYRAPHPQELVARQAAAWDPLLDWAAEAVPARLVPTTGVMHRAQPPESLAALAARVEALDVWRLTALHDLVVIGGSLVLGLAVLEGRLPAPEAWRLSRIDEDWNVELWGEDPEAADHARRRAADFLAAARLLDLLAD